MLQAERAKGALLPEYHRATPECPNPSRWHMYDSMTAEAEVSGIPSHACYDAQA